jgi:peptide/nickel transport system substrate-binding protein
VNVVPNATPMHGSARRILYTVAVAAAFLLAGCGGAQQAPAAPSDTLRLVSGADPPGLNPLVTDNANVTYFSSLVHGFLLDTDGEGRLVPSLAAAVPTAANGGISADGRTITYHLRRGVTWPDGTTFDARDVIFTTSAVLNTANNVPDRTGFDHIERYWAPDPYTVRVRLKRPFSPFVPSYLSLAANDPYPILPAHLLAGKHDLNRDAYNGKPVGLGPYEVASWQRGSRIEFVANPHYFRGKPGFAHVTVSIVPDINSAVTLWKTGAFDVIVARTTTGRTVFDAIRSVPGTHMMLKPHNEFDFLIFNTARAPLDDARVRRAIVEGFDRIHTMTVLDGDLWVPGDTDRLPGSFAYDPTIVQPKYDPQRAARDLDAAGWTLHGGVRVKSGKPLTIDAVSTTESTATTRFNLLLQQDLQKLGIRTELKSYAYNMVWAGASEGGINQTGRYDTEYSGWQPNSVDDHSYLFRCEDRPPNGDNFTRVCDPVIEAAAREELDSPDPKRQADGDRAITRELIAKSDLLFLGFTREGVAVRDGLEGVVPSVTGQHLWNVWSWRRAR